MRADQPDINAAGDQWLQGGIGRRLCEAVEPAVFQIRDARGKLEPEQGTEGKNMIRDTAAIGMVPVRARPRFSLVVEQAIKNMHGFARRRGDDLGMEWRVAIGDMGVEFGAGFIAVMCVEPRPRPEFHRQLASVAVFPSRQSDLQRPYAGGFR